MINEIGGYITVYLIYSLQGGLILPFGRVPQEEDVLVILVSRPEGVSAHLSSEDEIRIPRTYLLRRPKRENSTLYPGFSTKKAECRGSCEIITFALLSASPTFKARSRASREHAALASVIGLMTSNGHPP